MVGMEGIYDPAKQKEKKKEKKNDNPDYRLVIRTLLWGVIQITYSYMIMFRNNPQKIQKPRSTYNELADRP